MKKLLQSTTVTAGLAIFAMFFGAGNLIFPVKVGVDSGIYTPYALIAFMIAGVLLPLLGLVGIVFYDGDYKKFFHRMGKIPGKILILFCMLIIGPLYAMPRIVCLTYELMRPFIGNHLPLCLFSILFALLTFICSYKRTKIVTILGKVLSPLKLISLFTIIVAGLLTRNTLHSVDSSLLDTITSSLKEGYNTLDLLSAIFFGYIIISTLQKTGGPVLTQDRRALTKVMLYGGLIGGALLATVYTGMGFLAAYHGHGLQTEADPGKMFIQTVLRVLGNKGAFFMAVTVLIACLSTMISLTAVVSEYLRNNVVKNKISYVKSAIIVLFLTTLMAQFELGNLLKLYEPIIAVGYPVLIVLTLCNIAYKLFGFKPIKTPVLITLIIMTVWTTYDLVRTPALGRHQDTEHTIIPDASLAL